MRVVAIILYLVVLAVCGTGIHGTRPARAPAPGSCPPVYPSVSLNLTGANSNRYRDFVGELRKTVTQGSHTALGLRVLHPESQVSCLNHFVLVRLTNPSSDTVTLAIDVVNLHVVAFSANRVAYFFSDSSAVQRNNLFVDMIRIGFSFTADYISLEHQAGVGREDIPLGPNSLAEAISSLGRLPTSGETVARALLVVIQMVSDAARFRNIELPIRQSITDGKEFNPEPLMLSMENNWSSMSSEIQQALPGGIFSQLVQLVDRRNNPVEVANFRTLFQLTNIAVLLNSCPPATNAHIIKMPVFRVAEYGVEGLCPDQLEVTRRIGGLDGLCVEARDGLDDGNPIQLWPCGQQNTQQWTFHTDGTIRLMGKCLTTYGYSHGDYVMIYNCDTAVPDATKWELSIDGTITNPRSGLVLTVPEAGKVSNVSVENNIYAARQSWIVGNVEPLHTSIVGYNEMCLLANPPNNDVWLGNCSIIGVAKAWQLYGDGTIRVQSSQTGTILCVTADGHSAGDIIRIDKCQGSSNQRWVFNTNGTISNPNASLVMDVKQSDVSLRQIILYQPTGNPNQQWITYP